MIITSFVLVFIISYIQSRPARIDEEAIYPEGYFLSVKVSDLSNKEHKIEMTEDEISFILQAVKDSPKELAKGYDSGMCTIHMDFIDSVVYLLRKDDDTIYYTINNKKYCGLCYEVQSKKLSDYIKRKILL